jgi:predicted acetyltransferase
MNPQEIGNGLVMRNACAEDFPSLLEHFSIVHGHAIVDEFKALLEYHPRFSWEDSFIITRQDSREVISCVILLQNTWSLAGITFPTVEMGAVGTLESYRNRGHMWRLNEEFEKRVAEIQPAFQAIAGIPYFYRNFGYEYAAKLGGGYPVSPSLVPKLSESEEEPLTFEEVGMNNFEEFLNFRNKYLSSEAWRNTWHRELLPEHSGYLLFKPLSGESECFLYYLVKDAGKTVGVFYLSHYESLIDIAELYLDSYKSVDAVLRFALAKSEEWRGLPLRVVPPNQSQVREYIRMRSSVDAIRRYAWYIKIPSIPRFIRVIAPLLAARLKNTEFRTFSGELKITDYKYGYTLSFEKGKLRGVTNNEEREPRKYDLRMSRGALTRLLMGYESFDFLSLHEPDAICSVVMRPLVRALFPLLEANVDPPF